MESLETRLEKLERVEKENELSPLRTNLVSLESVKNGAIIRSEDISSTIEGRVLWKIKSLSIRGGDKMATIESNGTGKTTFTKKIVHGNPSISLSPSAKIGYFNQKIDTLELDKSILENAQSSSQQNETLTRTALAKMHFFRDGIYKPISVLSGGERVKVVLTKVFLSEVNTLVLDEPTNLLNMEAIEAFEPLLKGYNDGIIFVSHGREFTKKVATRIVAIDNKEIKIFDGTYGQSKQAGKPTRSIKENKKLLLEIKITEILSRLSIESSEGLEQEFQNLVNEKRSLDK